MPYFPPNTAFMEVDEPSSSTDGHQQQQQQQQQQPAQTEQQQEGPPPHIRIKNRRKRYLDTHPEYFDSHLELADPLLYDRLIRRFQTPAEREEEGRKKGFSGVLEADLWRSEAKLDALQHPDPNAEVVYTRGPHGEILAEEQDEVPASKAEALERWRHAMYMRFLRGADDDFDYATVDGNEAYDDWAEEERARQEKYFDEEEEGWVLEDEEGRRKEITGETGVQDF